MSASADGHGPDATVDAPADDALDSKRDAPIGGQAVLEGVMMRGISTWAVAVRKPSPEQAEAPGELRPDEPALDRRGDEVERNLLTRGCRRKAKTVSATRAAKGPS